MAARKPPLSPPCKFLSLAGQPVPDRRYRLQATGYRLPHCGSFAPFFAPFTAPFVVFFDLPHAFFVSFFDE